MTNACQSMPQRWPIADQARNALSVAFEWWKDAECRWRKPLTLRAISLLVSQTHQACDTMSSLCS